MAATATTARSTFGLANVLRLTCARRRTLRGLLRSVPSAVVGYLSDTSTPELLQAMLNLQAAPPTCGAHNLCVLRREDPLRAAARSSSLELAAVSDINALMPRVTSLSAISIRAVVTAQSGRSSPSACPIERGNGCVRRSRDCSQQFDAQDAPELTPSGHPPPECG